MEKENLIVVHSFPGNSFLLGGLVDFLSDYFEVYFIDLPGFTKNVSPLSQISFDGYARFMKKSIQGFGLDGYWLAGVSFGFYLTGLLQPDPRCHGLLALAPYAGLPSLRMGPLQSSLFRLFFKSVNTLKLWSILWSNPFSRKYLPKLRNYSVECIDNLSQHIDSRTFFTTGGLIFDHWDPYRFQDQPHILIANEHDRTINYDYVLDAFITNVEHLLVVNTTIDHSPPELTKSYFKRHMPEVMMQQILDFMERSKRQPCRSR